MEFELKKIRLFTKILLLKILCTMYRMKTHNRLKIPFKSGEKFVENSFRLKEYQASTNLAHH